MKFFFELFPTLAFIFFAQLLIKLRVKYILLSVWLPEDKHLRLFLYIKDPYIFSTYIAALISSLSCFFVY